MPSRNNEDRPLLGSLRPAGKSLWSKPLASIAIIGLALLLVVAALVDFFYFVRGTDGLTWEKGSSGIYLSRISLPLDYSDPDAGEVSVALFKLPATNRKEKLGSLLVNPGGPGGSGGQFLYSYGANISEAVDGRYDIIGFDPRGVNWTAPRFECTFGNSRLARQLGEPLLLSDHDGDDVSYGQLLTELKFEGTACSAIDGGKYISTALVATDMLNISRALGDEKLNYWGFSYGSVLGNTFAQMYPEHVGRMIVDGVMDARDYYKGSWVSNLENAEDVLNGFYRGCSESHACPINGTAKHIRKQVESLLKELKSEPRIVVEGNYTGLVTYDSFKGAFFSTMYAPKRWPLFANATADLLNGNATTFYSIYGIGSGDLLDSDDSGYATRCGDATNSSYTKEFNTVDQLRERVDQLRKASPFWYEMWAPGSCSHYSTVPVMLWDGPFQKVNASMLLIGNSYDPVTPLSSARTMSQFYHKGIVLHQDGYGHSSLSQRSNCTQSYVRSWLLHGELPANNTICPVDEKLFEPSSDLEVSDVFPTRFV